MVQLIVTPAILSALKSLPKSSREKLSLPETPTLNASISHTQLIALSQRLSSQHTSQEETGDSSTDRRNKDATDPIRPYTLSSLLRGTKLYRPPPPPKPEPSAEYLALKAKLEAEAEQKKYNALLNPPSASASKQQPAPIFASPETSRAFAEDTYDADFDAISPSLVLNILVSIIFTGFATFWGLSNFRFPKLLHLLPWYSQRRSDAVHYYHYPGTIASQPARVFVSLFVAIVVGVAEVVVYSAYLRKVDIAHKKEKAIVEKKVVIGAVEDKFEDNEVHEAPIPVGRDKKEEIWGKGVNGGARRRLRERWRQNEDETDHGDD